MNKEYIEREAALKIIYDKWFTTCSRISNSIRELAAADVVPVVHGEWIKQEQEYPMMGCKVIVGYKCSICGGKQELKTNYCCDCGARMDGGKSNG